MRQRRMFATLVPLALVLLTTESRPGALTTQTATTLRTVYVSALDSKSAPVAGLTPADFTVKEDGKARPVVTAEVSKTPMTIALFIDDSGLGLQAMREGAAGFVTRLRGAAEISITTTGGRNIRAQNYTTSTPTLFATVNRLFARNPPQPGGAYVVEGLAAAAADFTARETVRPVIASVAIEVPEISSMRASDALAAIQRSRAQVYLIRVGRPVIGEGYAVSANRGETMVDEAAQANAVFGQAPARSGGRIEQIAAVSGIPRLFDQLASELLGQYALSYATTDPNAVDLKFAVGTSRKGVKVRAQTRVGLPRN